jgi:hypothetical protein
MEERGLVQRRGKQYLLLKAWDSQEHKFVRMQSRLREEPSAVEPAAQNYGRFSVVADRRTIARGVTTLKGAAGK